MSPWTGHIIVTREAGQTLRWLDQLKAIGVAATGLPLLEFVALAPKAAVNPADFDWVLLASPRAVTAYVEAGFASVATPLAALGTGTATAIEAAGLVNALDLDSIDGATFAQAFSAQVSAPARLLLPGPRDRRPELIDGLAKAGFLTTVIDLYETRAVDPTLLPATPCAPDDLVFFCSPSAVKAFTGAWNLRPACVAIGATTAAETRSAGFPTRVAQAPNLQSMIRAAGLDHDLTVNLEHEA